MTNFRLFQNYKSFQTTVSNLIKMTEGSQKKVGNTVEKGEIAHYRQFLFFPVFSKELYCMQTHKNKRLLGKGFKILEYSSN